MIKKKYNIDLISKYENVIIFTFLFILTVVILCQSPLAPFSKQITANDSSIFITIGRNILEGDILYKDITDHKGPMVFIMNAFGLSLLKGKLIGIWILEIISLYISTIFTYQTARLFFGKFISLVSTSLSALYIFSILVGGNLSEEWALPYISIGLYIFVLNISRNQSFSVPHLFILSFTFIMAFLFKASYISIWCSFGFSIILQLILKEKWMTLTKYLIYIILFCSLTLLPFGAYFYHYGILYDAYYWMIEFNTQYGNTPDIASTLKDTIITLLGIRHLPILVIASILFSLIKKDYKKNKLLFYGYSLSIIITSYSCSIGNLYEHYNIVFAPLLVLTYGYLINIFRINTHYKRLALLIFITNSWYSTYFKDTFKANFINESPEANNINNLVHIIQQHSKRGDTIMGENFINRAIYVYCERKCINKYLANFHSPDITEEVLFKKPDIIVHNNHLQLNNSILSIYKLVEKYNNYDIYKLKE